MDFDARATATLGGTLAALLGLLLLISAALGPLGSGRIRFHLSPDAVAQYRGGEVVTIVLALALLATAPVWSADHLWVPALSAGAAAYTVYSLTTVVAGQEFHRHPGNAERAFLLYAAATALAVVLLCVAGRELGAASLSGPRTTTGWLLVVLAVVIAVLWCGQVAGFYRSGPTAEYDSATSLFWLVKYLDLGIVVPLALLTGLLQWLAPSSASDAAAVAMLGFLTLMLMALLGMAAEMLRTGAAGASWVLAVGVAVLLAPTAIVWALWLVASDRA